MKWAKNYFKITNLTLRLNDLDNTSYFRRRIAHRMVLVCLIPTHRLATNTYYAYIGGTRNRPNCSRLPVIKKTGMHAV